MKNAVKWRVFLWCVYFSVIPAIAFGQISFEHIGLSQGLSQSTVLSIAQDRKGNMWFATYDGLNRFDGYNFTVYQHDDSDSTSISSDIIRVVMTDGGGNLWVGTHRGLSLYDMDKDVFCNFRYRLKDKDAEVLHIEEWEKGHLLVNTTEGLVLFDKRKKAFADVPSCLRPLRPTAVERNDEQIFFGQGSELMAYSFFTHSLSKMDWFHSKKDRRILSIFQQAKNKLWVGTEGNGLFLLDVEGERMKHYSSGNRGLSSDYIRALAVDMESRLWVGTINSLNIYDEKKDEFIVYNSDPVREGSLSQASVRSIYCDSQGGMWLGTYFGGLNYYHPLRRRFRVIKNIPYHNSLSDNVVNCIREDKEGNLWIGTNSGGLNFYDAHSGLYTCYSRNSGLEFDDVKSLYIDEDDDLVYIGGHSGGLNVLNRRTGNIVRYTMENSGLQTRNVYSIIPDSDGSVWLGTSNGEIYRFFPHSQKFERMTCYVEGEVYKDQGRIAMCFDSQGRLWVGGTNGANVYLLSGNRLESTDSIAGGALRNEIVNCIHENLKHSCFWIGTRNGLYCLDGRARVLRHYTVRNGLPNNVIQGIMEDSAGMLWVSTDRGLACLDVKEETFRNYSVVDGLSCNQFNIGAYCMTASGRMYFGSVDGIVSFNPETLTESPFIPAVLITELQVANKTVKPFDDTGVLKKHISETDKITLSAGQSSFMLKFAVTDYISGTHNRFAYRLDGYEKDWIYVENPNRFAVYSNLPAGDYRFMVKAANRDGLWNDVPTVLEIKILPMWYQTWWARMLFFVCAVGVIAFIIRYFWIRKTMQLQLEMERMDKEKAREINEMKVRFFINISHELRTPLTLIVGPLRDVLPQITDTWVLSKLKYVNANAGRLLFLVNQLLDYRRAELGVFHLKVSETDVHALAEKVFNAYTSLSESKQIAYHLNSDMRGKKVMCDGNYVELILNNLLSNAFKYTPKGGSITLALKGDDKNLSMLVSDTGQGIPPEKQNLVFERFYQVNHENIGSGIGLSLVKKLVDLHHGTIELTSSVGKGSVFAVCLPVSAGAYTADELAGETDEKAKVEDAVVRMEDCLPETNAGEQPRGADEDEDGQCGQQGKQSVLLVEDNADIIDYLADGLKDYFHVLKAGNGQEAWEILQNEEVNLILTDVMMPVMDGIRLCSQVKRNLKTSHIPVVILSAKADVKDQLEGLHVGADDYIPKPFVMEVVIAKIRNVLRTYRQAVEFYSKSLEVKPEKMALNPLDEEFLTKAVKIVENYLDDVGFSADKFAAEMNMSRSSLHLKMKAITGDSTMDFIRKIRFSHACRLLEEGRYNITEISEMVGFNTPSYFTTSFKKYMGCSPTEYVNKESR